MTPRRFGSAAVALAFMALTGASAASAAVPVDATSRRATATVSPEFLSFGIDASQLLTRGGGTPFDFTRERLRRLTAPVAPALIRFSGTRIDQTLRRSPRDRRRHLPPLAVGRCHPRSI